MKKILLLLVFTTYFGMNSQVLSLDDHSNLTIGNIGTDITGVVPGQDGYLTYSATTTPVTSNSNFQIVDKGGDYGNAIQIIGSSNASGSRDLQKTNLQALWSSRNIGNNKFEFEVDIFTGPASTSRNEIRIFLYSDEAVPRIISGVAFAKNITLRTGNIPPFVATDFTNLFYGAAFSNSSLPGSHIAAYGPYFNSPTPQTPILDNSWIKLGFSYNKITGQTKWKGTGINGVTSAFQSAFATNLSPSKLVISVNTGNRGQITDGATPPVVISPAIQNAASATFAFDNIKISATSIDNLLSTDSFNEINRDFNVYPNPSSSIVTISNTENITINKIAIIDVNGRIVKSENFINLSNIELNISELNTGLYFLNIYNEKGMTTKKIIKN